MRDAPLRRLWDIETSFENADVIIIQHHDGDLLPTIDCFVYEAQIAEFRRENHNLQDRQMELLDQNALLVMCLKESNSGHVEPDEQYETGIVSKDCKNERSKKRHAGFQIQ